MWLLYLVCCLVLMFLLLPVLVVVPMGFSNDRYLAFPPPGLSLQHFAEVMSDPSWLQALRNSFLVGCACALFSTAIGTLAALGLDRMRPRLRVPVLIFVTSPLVVPLVVPAVGLFFMYSEFGMLQSFSGMVLAHTLLAAPVVLVVVSAALQGLNPNLERAAAGLGANPQRAILTVVLPSLAPGMVVGALFAFITSFDEVILALFLSGVRMRTLPVKMFDSIQFEVGLSTAAVGTLFIVLAALTLIGAEVFRRRGQRRTRRGR